MADFNEQTAIIDFDNSGDYIFDPFKVEVSGGEGRLALEGLPSVFNEDYADDTGFTYDPSKAEFVAGKVQQIYQRITDATFGATYTTDVNGNWGEGVLTGTPSGGASVVGGKLDLTGNTIQYVDYDANLNADFADKGAIGFKLTPGYSGTPATTQVYICNSKNPGDSDNEILIFHDQSGGTLNVFCRDNTGAITIGAVSAGAWSPAAGTTYEFELNYDYTLLVNTIGNTRLFVEGSIIAEDLVSLSGRDSDINLLRIGTSISAGTTADFAVEDLVVYDEVQHTANYTPGYTLPEADYVETKVELPQFAYSGGGSVQGFTAFSTTEAGSPKYIMNDLYYSGGWVASDGTYAQSSTATEIATQIATLPASNTMNVDLVFPDLNTISDADYLELSYTGQIYPTDNPTLEVDTDYFADALISLTETSTKTGLDEIKAIVKVGTVWVWLNPASGEWEESDETYLQSNTIAEINANIGFVLSERRRLRIRLFLHSETGETTPAIDELVFVYAFAASTADSIDICTVYWYSVNPDSSICDCYFRATLSEASVKYKTQTLVCQTEVSDLPDSEDGYTELNLIPNTDMSKYGSTKAVTYLIEKGELVGENIVWDALNPVATISVPVTDSEKLWDITA